VHSGKDLPAGSHPDLVIAAVPPRADPRDVLVGATLATLSSGALIATGSVRRRAQLAWLRPDLTYADLRGNIATRLEKIPQHGAIVMAAAALDRLSLFDKLDASGIAFEVLEPHVMLPQVAQGCLAVECRADDHDAIALLASIDDPASRVAFECERAFLGELGGDCDLPAGAHATVAVPAGTDTADGGDRVGQLRVEGLLASLDGHTVLRMRRVGPADAAVELGTSLARALLDDAGGSALLAR